MRMLFSIFGKFFIVICGICFLALSASPVLASTCFLGASVNINNEVSFGTDLVFSSINDAPAFFPFVLMIGDPVTGNILYEQPVIVAGSCNLSPQRPVCSFSIAGNKATFNIPELPQEVYYYAQLRSQNVNGESIICQQDLRVPPAIQKSCGQPYNPATETCSCSTNSDFIPPQASARCCGWADSGLGGCSATDPNLIPNPPVPPPDTSPLFTDLNSAIFDGPPATELTTPRGIISKLLPYLFVFGGLILFIMIIWGGFEMLTGAAEPKSQEAGKHRITNAIIGFLILFCSYFLAQLVELILSVDIL